MRQVIPSLKAFCALCVLLLVVPQPVSSQSQLTQILTEQTAISTEVSSLLTTHDEGVQAQNTPEATSTPTNEECLRASLAEAQVPANPLPQILFHFEEYAPGSENQSWVANEIDFKVANTAISDRFAHCGNQSLEILTELDANSDEDVFHHTVPTAYFDRTPPIGVKPKVGAGYDFSGGVVHCFVHIPPDFPTGGDERAAVYLFVKDGDDRNLQGQWVDISADNVGTWILLSAFVEEGSEHADPGFAPADVNAIGIAVITPDNSTLKYDAKNHGAIYVDDCIITGEQV